MSLTGLRRKRILIPSSLAALALVIGGVFWASTASADLGGSERDRVVAAARATAGDGDVISAESSDPDPDDADADDRLKAYEVEIRKADGSEVEVSLDKDLNVVGSQRDDDRSDDTDSAADADDRVLGTTERARAEKAATDAVGGGTVTDADASDDRGVAYEVDVRTTDGTEWNVDLDAAYAVVSKTVDR